MTVAKLKNLIKPLFVFCLDESRDGDYFLLKFQQLDVFVPAAASYAKRNKCYYKK